MRIIDRIFELVSRNRFAISSSNRLDVNNGSISTPLFTITDTYSAKVVKVYDADTIHVVMEFMGELCRFKIRLKGIDAPEVTGKEKPQGISAKIALTAKICDQIVTVDCDGFDKYGRLLATIYYEGQNINDWLVSKKLAVYKEY